MADERGRPNPLTLADIKATADMFRVSPYEYEDFLEILLTLDQIYIQTRNEQIAERERRDAQRNKRRGKR